MRHATSVLAETPLSVAAELLKSAPRRLLAVVDAEYRPLGVLTPTHVLKAVCGRTRDELSAVTSLEASTSGGSLLPGSARLESAARVLAGEDRDFSLVVDEQGKLLGALMATDILSAIA